MMRALAATDVLRIWEAGEYQTPVALALTMLAGGDTDRTAEELADLNVRQRDAQLLALRRLTLGSRLDGVTDCPRCQERLEFTQDIVTFHSADPAASAQETYELITKDLAIRFRLPNSHDMALAGDCEDLHTARRLLAARCVLEVTTKEAAPPKGGLPAAVLNLLSNRMSECAGEADVLLDFACPACGHDWRAMLDVVAFFWTEIAAYAKRVLREVHVLARAYGWRERDILAMSPRRRRHYLDLVGQ